ncbi:hypothetical protein [Streptomonospora nanhaiensis]|uniref:hypothetical protein n=1 Tax=Streptomonospora nanhaiensis TaxID=1323731 RepID=UPI001C383AD5|nr:hypothetical protein [Streptomonospora nanhaiensis]MBV2366955.1 hypothetical protein [Streptomonospora nanhaiensis]
MTHILDAVAPLPEPDADGAIHTGAAELARRYTAAAQYHSARAIRLAGTGRPGDWIQASEAFHANYTAAVLLRALAQHAPHAADEAARRIIRDTHDGALMHERAWEMAHDEELPAMDLYLAGDASARTQQGAA